jgi:hypothetical protein
MEAERARMMEVVAHEEAERAREAAKHAAETEAKTKAEKDQHEGKKPDGKQGQ